MARVLGLHDSAALENPSVKNKKLGEILLSCDLVTEEQLTTALKTQSESDGLALGQILVRDGILTQRDLNITLDYYDKRQKLGEILLSRKVINQKQLGHALELSKTKKISLGKQLVLSNMISEDQLAQALSKQYDMPVMYLKEIDFSQDLHKYINRTYAIKNRVVVVEKVNNAVTLAMAIPLSPIELSELESAIRLKIVGAIATDSDITLAHERIYGSDRPGQKKSREIDLILEDFSGEDVPSRYVHQYNVEQLLKKLLTVAVNAEASDIHLENTEDGMFPRFRIDGVLQSLDLDASTEEIRTCGLSIVSKIKIQCDLDIAERRRPQDGSFRVQIASDGKKRHVDFRVSVIPTRFGENVVIRILDRVRPMSLSQLGFPPAELKELNRLLDKPTGVYLVTGPTGSGKTSTLYTILNQVAKPEVKTLTAEDPIEYSLGKNVSQCEVNEKIGNTFASLLRSFLRQDPDYIMVGEMRDLETCSIAIRAALTGHTVLSTLHANDSTSAVTRLIDMNVDPTLIAATLRGVIAQRLVRANCLHCREAHQPKSDILDGIPEVILNGIKHLHGSGCAMCNYTGFSGRRLISEIWVPTREESIAMMRISDSAELRELVFQKTGRKTMLQNGLELVRNGETTLEELLRNVPSEHVMGLMSRLRDFAQKRMVPVPGKSESQQD